ncbi:hypothetical protein CJF30_00003656 [Rutstroemia sp. NJR-2017a BBW]|nr:hypothetical protein CJF30_00003656 [Rutstroemia sp. NJR-2017a BBW]
MSARKRVSQACRPCGAKKIKCDGGTPICGPCQLRHNDCSYGISRRGHSARRLNSGSLPGTPAANLQPTLSPLPHAPANPFAIPNGSIPQTQQESGSRLHANSHEQIRLAPIIYPQKEPAPRIPHALGPDVAKQLFQTYFDCIHPLWPILYKPMYTSFDYTYPSPKIPNCLATAIFAIASCVDVHPSKQNIGERQTGIPAKSQFYFEETLSFLQKSEGNNDRTLKSVFTPSIATCQTLTILSLQQHGVAEYSRAATLCGLASSMAIELRLHRPYEVDDPTQREIRYRLWWNLFILEKMISCEMGRPVILRTEETDTPYPSTSEADEFELFSPPAKRQETSDPVPISGKLRTLSVLGTTIGLATIMERISREVYGLSSRKSIRDDPVVGEAKRMELWSALKRWEGEVESSPLRLDLSERLTSVPSLITNYVIMCSGTILLHRPFIARWISNSEGNDPVANPLRVCLDAAQKICDILEKYFDILYGLPCDMVFSIFTAASTLLYQVKQPDGADIVDSQRRLRMCIHWLSVLGKSWKSAGARQQLLADLSAMPQDANVRSPVAAASQPDLGTMHMSSPQVTLDGARLPVETLSKAAKGPSPSDDWEFLRDFGDPSDEFYILDEELRGLLDGDHGWKL